MADFPTFPEFFAAVRGKHTPFPWQEALASRAVDADWPELIDIPTGLGKTAVIDIAVWALAHQLHQGNVPRSHPTRVWYVVDRRLLVDAAADRAQELSKWLSTVRSDGQPEQLSADDAATIRPVAEALGRAADHPLLPSEPLTVTRLRGGAPLGERPVHPAQPALIFSTVAMFASRWLFRGYGTSRLMRPVDAALAGTDSLVLIDEAHLASELMALRDPLFQCDPGREAVALLAEGRRRPRFVALTATGARRDGALKLSPEDLADGRVIHRLEASKPTRLVNTNKSNLVRVMAEAALAENADRPEVCLVFTNTPERARAVANALQLKVVAPDKVVILTGRMREQEARVARQRVLARAHSGWDRRTATEPLWIVATQTLEVGADLDADHLVTETAGVRALVQRFGRLNRLGDATNPSGVICHATDVAQPPLYGTEVEEVWKRLAGRDHIDLRASAVDALLGEPAALPETPAEPLPGLVWEWVKSCVTIPDEAPPEAYFSERPDDAARVSLVWRAVCPPRGEQLRPRIRADESIDLPLTEWRKLWIARRDQLTGVGRLDDEQTGIQALGQDDTFRPGDTLVIPTTAGLYDREGWNPDAREPVLDVSLLRARLLPLLRLDDDGHPRPCISVLGLPADRRLNQIVDELTGQLVPTDDDVPGLLTVEELDSSWVRSWRQRLLDDLRSAGRHPWLSAEEWEEWLDRLAAGSVEQRDGLVWLKGESDAAAQSAVTAAALRAPDDDLSFVSGASPLLSEHLTEVAEVAKTIATAMQLPPSVVTAIDHAARWHDLGKADPRFQRWLAGDQPPRQLLAKSRTDANSRRRDRMRSGWPSGGRHEVISARLVSEGLLRDLPEDVDADLVVHLVAAHHGHGRPSLPVVWDPGETRTTVRVPSGPEVTTISVLSDPLWDQPARFRRLCECYGYWGLALLEAVVRQSDHAVSQATVI